MESNLLDIIMSLMNTYFLWVLLLGLSLSACRFAPDNVELISIKGSDTEVNLVLSLAETYMSNHEDVSISVNGGGSGAGIAALINNKTDLANSSRAMKQEELELARAQNVEPVSTVFAIDALALIVHESNPLDSLHLSDLSQIYSGAKENWSDFGGAQEVISLYGRQSNSGTFVYFRDAVVKAEYSTNVKQMNGTAQIVEAVKNDKAGLGYVGLGYVVDKEDNIAKGLKVLTISPAAGTSAVDPTILSNVTSGKYVITRPLYQYTNGKPKGMLLEFLKYEWSELGQKMVQENGYYPISQFYMDQNLKTISPANEE